ncbi:MAG: MFS transporter [Polyangia bacterium]|jgi:MFS family permease
MPISAQSRLLLRISFLVTFAESMLVPIYAAFTEKVGGSILDAGIAFAIFSMATGTMVGLLGTRPLFQRRVREFLALGLWASVCCDVSYVFVQNKWQLFAVQVVAGLATGLIEPAWDSVFSDGIAESSVKHWSIWAGGTHLFAGVAALAGSIIVAHFSFVALFLAMAAIDAMAASIASTNRIVSGQDAPSRPAPGQRSEPAALSLMDGL